MIIRVTRDSPAYFGDVWNVSRKILWNGYTENIGVADSKVSFELRMETKVPFKKNGTFCGRYDRDEWLLAEKVIQTGNHGCVRHLFTPRAGRFFGNDLDALVFLGKKRKDFSDFGLRDS